MGYHGLEIAKADGTRIPVDFRRRKPELAEYLYIESIYDRQERMGRMHWTLHDGKTVGYMMLAVGHVTKMQQAGLGIGAYGHLPALAIARWLPASGTNGAGREGAWRLLHSPLQPRCQTLDAA